jgi:Ribbon-helix-helix domain
VKGFIYGTMYGVKRTTIYLTETQKRELEVISGRTRQSEAELIREGVDHVIDLKRLPGRKPGPIFALDDPILDDPNRVDEGLDGFGSE